MIDSEPFIHFTRISLGIVAYGDVLAGDASIYHSDTDQQYRVNPLFL